MSCEPRRGSMSASKANQCPSPLAPAQGQKVLSAGRARGPATGSPPRSREREGASSSVKGSLRRASPPLTDRDAPRHERVVERMSSHNVSTHKNSRNSSRECIESRSRVNQMKVSLMESRHEPLSFLVAIPGGIAGPGSAHHAFACGPVGNRAHALVALSADGATCISDAGQTGQAFSGLAPARCP